MVEELKRALVRKQSAQLLKGWAAAKVATVVGVAMAAASSAHAALSTEITTAITDAGANLLAAATAVVVAMVAFWAMKKLGSNMGWF